MTFITCLNLRQFHLLNYIINTIVELIFKGWLLAFELFEVIHRLAEVKRNWCIEVCGWLGLFIDEGAQIIGSLSLVVINYSLTVIVISCFPFCSIILYLQQSKNFRLRNVSQKHLRLVFSSLSLCFHLLKVSEQFDCFKPLCLFISEIVYIVGPKDDLWFSLLTCCHLKIVYEVSL